MISLNISNIKNYLMETRDWGKEEWSYKVKPPFGPKWILIWDSDINHPFIYFSLTK